MAKLLSTIWAFLLNVFGLPVFRTCFDNNMEDENCESPISGQLLSSFFFSLGVYIIILDSTLFPQSYRKPQMFLLKLYEFLVATFILEFTLACVWTPINVLLVTTMPRAIYHVLRQLELKEAAVAFSTIKSWMTVATYTVSITFFLLTLHVTDAVDYTILWDEGMTEFMTHVEEKLWEKLQREIPFLNAEAKPCRCKVRRSGPRRNRANSSEQQ